LELNVAKFNKENWEDMTVMLNTSLEMKNNLSTSTREMGPPKSR
jgi:hypothetical protein